MSVNIIYGSDSGGTASVADTIAAKLPGAKVINVKSATKADFENCELLILGSPTYGLGDVQDDWVRGLGLIEAADLKGHKVALFGTGDQVSYSDTFVDAVGTLYDAVVASGAEVVGSTSTDGFNYDASKAERDGHFVGLVLDEYNQRAKSQARIDSWLKSIQ